MIGLFYLLIATGIILMGANTIFIFTALTIPEYINPIASLFIFIILAAISLFFIYIGFNLHIILPFIL